MLGRDAWELPGGRGLAAPEPTGSTANSGGGGLPSDGHEQSRAGHQNERARSRLFEGLFLIGASALQGPRWVYHSLHGAALAPGASVAGGAVVENRLLGDRLLRWRNVGLLRGRGCCTAGAAHPVDAPAGGPARRNDLLDAVALVVGDSGGRAGGVPVQLVTLVLLPTWS